MLRRAQDSRKPHNEARVVFNKAALGSLAQVLASQMRRNGSALDDSDLAMLREDLRTSYDVKVALNTAWLPLPPEKLLEDLYARPNWLASLTPHWTPERRALLERGRGGAFTVEDPRLLANMLYASGLGTLQLGRVAMLVSEDAPGVPRISRVTAEQVRDHMVATALAVATGPTR